MLPVYPVIIVHCGGQGVNNQSRPTSGDNRQATLGLDKSWMLANIKNWGISIQLW